VGPGRLLLLLLLPWRWPDDMAGVGCWVVGWWCVCRLWSEGRGWACVGRT